MKKNIKISLLIFLSFLYSSSLVKAQEFIIKKPFKMGSDYCIKFQDSFCLEGIKIKKEDERIWEYAINNILSKNEYDEKSKKIILLLSEKKYPIFQWYAGEMYLEGRNVEIDYNKAFDLLNEAAKGGVRWAERDLCDIYNNGTILNIDKKTAYFWCSKAALHGDGEDLYKYAIMNIMNYNNKVDEIDFFKMIKKAYFLGYKKSIFALGYAYLYGIGTEKNHDLALKFFLESIENEELIGIIGIYTTLLNNDLKSIDEKEQDKIKNTMLLLINILGFNGIPNIDGKPIKKDIMIDTLLKTNDFNQTIKNAIIKYDWNEKQDFKFENNKIMINYK